MKLTAKAVAALTLPTGKTDVIVFDDEHARLRLSAAHRCWRQGIALMGRAISPCRASRRLLLGCRPRCSAPSRRATMAKKALGRVANGEDPQADQARSARQGHTYAQGHRRRLLGDQAARGAPAHLHRDGALSHRHALFRAVAQPRARSDHPQGRRHPVEPHQLGEQLDRGRARPRAAQSRCSTSGRCAHGLVEANPVVGTPTPKGSQPRERVLSDAELAAIWKACGDDDHGRCIRLLILTGCRRQEIGGIAWPRI